jgi:hypothetical protein
MLDEETAELFAQPCSCFPLFFFLASLSFTGSATGPVNIDDFQR